MWEQLGLVGLFALLEAMVWFLVEDPDSKKTADERLRTPWGGISAMTLLAVVFIFLVVFWK